MARGSEIVTPKFGKANLHQRIRIVRPERECAFQQRDSLVETLLLSRLDAGAV
ncbi:hypothetical protein [Borborobacter arsenicus]|uniref:hypothetical protein n=1 Tax=Borborobacter arsenicus TaxID=1851146 RepID=UPI00315D8E60